MKRLCWSRIQTLHHVLRQLTFGKFQQIFGGIRSKSTQLSISAAELRPSAPVSDDVSNGAAALSLRCIFLISKNKFCWQRSTQCTSCCCTLQLVQCGHACNWLWQRSHNNYESGVLTQGTIHQCDSQLVECVHLCSWLWHQSQRQPPGSESRARRRHEAHQACCAGGALLACLARTPLQQPLAGCIALAQS